MTSPSATVETTRYNIQQLLPTCQRCKRLRRRCDTQLPSCRTCNKAGTECTFYDHALKQALPRAYVQSLLTRVAHLEAVQNGTNSSPFAASPAPLQPVITPSDPVHDSSVLDTSPSFDVLIPSTSTAGNSRFWGSSSVFALTIEILQHAASRDLVSLDHSIADIDPEESHVDDQYSYTKMQAPDSDIQNLVHIYLVSLNTMYGFVDQSETNADLQTYLAMRQQPHLSPQDLRGMQAHTYFRFTMMCAISCANLARYKPQRTAECLVYYAAAVACIEEVTSEVSPASLQALLLLIVFYLFYPRKGDIWKLLDYACRLAIELGYHTEAENDQAVGAEPETEAKRKLRRSTFWGLYAIERIVGQLFGRGSDLPETITTIEYPSTLHIGANSGVAVVSTPNVDQPTMQSMSIAHHYRLVYLRSEIFRSMYLPASPPDLGLDWLREKYTSLYAWRQELAVSDGLEGVATVTCDVGYDATICFLFQPLLLKALRATTTPRPPNEHNGIGLQICPENCCPLVASDPFYSSVNLIRTYEKVIRAPASSAFGIYPLTFLSAHYIYLATSTLLAYALLRLDGHTIYLKRMCNSSGSVEDETEEIDWGILVDVSSSCLIMLAWCGERWPGMLGMLGEFQRLYRRVVREFIMKGIVR